MIAHCLPFCTYDIRKHYEDYHFGYKPEPEVISNVKMHQKAKLIFKCEHQKQDDEIH